MLIVRSVGMMIDLNAFWRQPALQLTDLAVYI